MHFYPSYTRQWRDSMLASARMRELTDAHKRDMEAVLRRVAVLERALGCVVELRREVGGLRQGLVDDDNKSTYSLRALLGSPVASKPGSVEWVEVE